MNTYGVRFGKGLGAPWRYHLKALQVMDICETKSIPCRLEDVTVVTIPIHVARCQLLNGELVRNELGLYLYYSTYPDIMRISLEKGGVEVTGLRAKYVLEKYIDDSSLDCLYDLLDEYTDAVIEFTVYSEDVGVIPRRSTIIWEVRNY